LRVSVCLGGMTVVCLPRSLPTANEGGRLGSIVEQMFYTVKRRTRGLGVRGWGLGTMTEDGTDDLFGFAV
jgi:hypothetical protein